MKKMQYQKGGANQDVVNNDKLRQIREMQEKGPQEPGNGTTKFNKAYLPEYPGRATSKLESGGKKATKAK